MALTKSEVIEHVRLNLDDAGVGTYYSAEDLNDAFLDIYDDVVCKTLPFEKTATISIVGNRVYYDLYNSIPDYILPIALYHEDLNRWLEQKSIKFFEGLNYRWELEHGNPVYYAVVDFRFIALYPHPRNTSGTFTLYYKSRPPEPEDSDVVPLSKHNDTILTDGITAVLLAQAEEFQKAGNYYQDYMAAVIKERNLIEGRTSPDKIFRLAMQELRQNV